MNPSLPFNLRASFPTSDETKDFFSAAARNDIPALKAIISKFPTAASTFRRNDRDVISDCYGSLSVETLKFLVAQGADINHKTSDGFWTPLILATFQGTPADIEKLVVHGGADVNLCNQSGHSALSFGLEKPANARMLVLCGAVLDAKAADSFDYRGYPLVRDVIARAQAERRDFMTRNASATYGFSPQDEYPSRAVIESFFTAAKRNDAYELEKTLQKWPAAASTWYDHDGNPVCVAAYQSMNAKTYELLHRHGADINQMDTKASCTPLRHAALVSNADTVQKLIEFGADVHVQTRFGSNALETAVRRGDKPIVDLLVLCGAELTAENKKSLKSEFNEDMQAVIAAAAERRAQYLAGQSPAADVSANSPQPGEALVMPKPMRLRRAPLALPPQPDTQAAPAAPAPEATKTLPPAAAKPIWRRILGM